MNIFKPRKGESLEKLAPYSPRTHHQNLGTLREKKKKKIETQKQKKGKRRGGNQEEEEKLEGLDTERTFIAGERWREAIGGEKEEVEVEVEGGGSCGMRWERELMGRRPFGLGGSGLVGSVAAVVVVENRTRKWEVGAEYWGGCRGRSKGGRLSHSGANKGEDSQSSLSLSLYLYLLFGANKLLISVIIRLCLDGVFTKPFLNLNQRN